MSEMIKLLDKIVKNQGEIISLLKKHENNLNYLKAKADKKL